MIGNITAAVERVISRGILRVALWLVLLALATGLRLWRLDTDAFRALSWDTGLFTDEGFYTHAARNVMLFGHARTDDFNNSLLMPTLHYLQIFVFHGFGYGMLQARLISITLSLLTLPVFYAAMKRAFGVMTATYAVLFLGLDHVPLLYSRMALMDTAAAFLIVCAFYTFTVLTSVVGRRAAIAAAVCGLTLGLLYATRGLAAVVIPAPFVALLPSFSEGAERGKRGRRKKIAATLFGGLMVALAVYVIWWYLPHHVELARVNRYHVREQLLPKTAHQMGLNIVQAAKGTQFLGLLPYLAFHAPVLLALTVSVPFVRRGRARLSDFEARSVVYLVFWLLALFALFALVNYSPSRYYVLFYPALCGLAAVGMGRRVVRAVNDPSGEPEANRSATKTISAVIISVWAVINLGWYADWARHLATTQRDASQLLARTLPPNSVLLGDCAPGLGIYNDFVTVNVMPGLCNDKAPLARWAGRPRYVVILDGPYKNTNEKWWGEHYPNVVRERNRVFLFDPLVLRPVGVYKVEAKDAVWRTGESP